MSNYIIKVFHSFDKGTDSFVKFISNLGKVLELSTVTFGFTFKNGEIFYNVSIKEEDYPVLESQFYSAFNNFQITKTNLKLSKNFKSKDYCVGEIILENKGFFPLNFPKSEGEDSFIYNLFRTIENFDVLHDEVGYYVRIKPIKSDNFLFFILLYIKFFLFKIRMFIKSFKFMLNFKLTKGWKKQGYNYFSNKISDQLFEVSLFIVAKSNSKNEAKGKIKSLFQNFMVFNNYPLNKFHLKFQERNSGKFKKFHFNSKEVGSFFHFPSNPKSETSLHKVTSIKLALPNGLPILNYKILNNNEVIPDNNDKSINILGISDYRSTFVPVGIYDQDRLKHMYIIGKTGVGKSKYIINLIINDIKNGKGLCVIDPHGDLIEESMIHIPESRYDDVVIFDPTDYNYPFCINPLEVNQNESKQILAKGFIDIFKKYFGANWNNKLEHVLRMTFLALLDKKNSNLYDIIRALTDKNFRYEMIEEINDDVVRNFWTNEFSGWSQQFNNEAIMPILNKIGQLLSIETIKNIFGASDNKIDFRDVMDQNKILFIKLPKGQLQEEIMGFLGAMFITKIYQSSMSRQNLEHSKRSSFFLYVDEFHNFATDTFNVILAEARKYGLSLTVAHQYLSQIPPNISSALFGNVGTFISFRVSPDDASVLKSQFEPFISGYDLSNLDQRLFYVKTLVKGHVKEPFILKSVFIDESYVLEGVSEKLYDLTRKTYCRPLNDVKSEFETKNKDVIEIIEEFSEPLI